MGGRGRAEWSRETGIELDRLPNLKFTPSVPDPREFYAVTKVLLMPSLWNESFGLVAAEAMLNGIPILASNRGALPETVGEEGFLFDIPAQYTPVAQMLPAIEEIEPWVETVIRLSGRRGTLSAGQPGGAGAGPALAPRAHRTPLSRVLQQHLPSTRSASSSLADKGRRRSQELMDRDTAGQGFNGARSREMNGCQAVALDSNQN